MTGDDIWATIENALAIICACLTVYRPLLSRGHAFALSVTTWYSSLLGSTQRSRKAQTKQTEYSQGDEHSGAQARSRYGQIEDGTLDNIYLTKATGGSEVEGGFVAGENYPLNAINVKETTEVV